MMKSSIFKIFTKKILRSEAFISVIVVFVLALGIIGTSYALYMDVDTDTNYQTVKVGDLAISFDNGDNTINLENMIPMEDEFALKSTENIFSFYIYNTGNYKVNYNISLEPDNSNQDELNEILPKYINYQICKDNIENCSEVKTLGDSIDDTIINNPIYRDFLLAKKESDVTNPSAYYFLRIWVNNTYNETAGGRIKYKVVVDATNASNTDTLAATILNSAKAATATNDTSKTIYSETSLTMPAQEINDANERVLVPIDDSYGTSYYFRGSVNDNYVQLVNETKNSCWRIVRIEGDGAIKLVYLGEKKCKDITDSNSANVGMTGYDGDNATEWFSTNTILTNLKNNGKLKKDIWCKGGSYSYLYSKEGVLLTGGAINKNSSDSYYGEYMVGTEHYDVWYSLASKRLRGLGTNQYASLKCSNEETTYESYIGNLTADEIVLAGGKIGSANSSFYLLDNSEGFVSDTYGSGGSGEDRFNKIYVKNDGTLEETGFNLYDIRPAITLIDGIDYLSGDGTKTNPYIIN